jgi:hypothetical protein
MTFTPSLNKSTAKAVEMARLHLRTGDLGAYVRVLSAEHRCANPRQQNALWGEILTDGMADHFYLSNGCLLGDAA